MAEATFAFLALTLVAILLICSLPRPSQGREFTPTDKTNIDRMVDKVMNCRRDIPAISVSLVDKEGVKYEQGYGKPSPTSRMPVTKDTVFCLGSSTQAFTSVLLAALLSYNENFTFDTPLRKIIGSPVHLPGRFRTDYVNLKDILGMRTGLSNMDIIVSANAMDRYSLQSHLLYAPEVQGFRDGYVFNELVYTLAEDVAHALRAAGGNETWYRLIRQYIFDRLEMQNAGFINVDTRGNPKLATPIQNYQDEPKVVPLETFKGQTLVAAATSVCASASDMSKWIHFILSGGKDRRGRQIISEEALKSTFQSVLPRSGNDKDTRLSGFLPTYQLKISYIRDNNALGWIKGQYRGYSFVSQDGSLPGYESLTTILPTENVGVFTAFTGGGGARAYAVKVLVNVYAIDILLHGQPWLTHDSICDTLERMEQLTAESEPKRPRAGRTAQAVRPLRDYVGNYQHYGFGNVKVRYDGNNEFRNGSLDLEYGEMGNYTLWPIYANDTFMMVAKSLPLTFAIKAERSKADGDHLATFGTRYDDSNAPIETITIPHFARDMDPVFSKHPHHPRQPEEYYCDACAAVVSVWLLATSVLMSVMGWLR